MLKLSLGDFAFLDMGREWEELSSGRCVSPEMRRGQVQTMLFKKLHMLSKLLLLLSHTYT